MNTPTGVSTPPGIGRGKTDDPTRLSDSEASSKTRADAACGDGTSRTPAVAAIPVITWRRVTDRTVDSV